jgi:hypothetical protein
VGCSQMKQLAGPHLGNQISQTRRVAEIEVEDSAARARQNVSPIGGAAAWSHNADDLRSQLAQSPTQQEPVLP